MAVLSDLVSGYDENVFSLGESENGFVIRDHMDSSTPKKRKIQKGLFFHDKTGWRHAIHILKRYFSRTALEFN